MHGSFDLMEDEVRDKVKLR